MKAAMLILSFTLISSFLNSATSQAEPSWFPFQYPCDTDWIEGERYYCETKYNMTDLLSEEKDEMLTMQARRFCKMEGGAFMAIFQNGERGFRADDGDYEPFQIYGLKI